MVGTVAERFWHYINKNGPGGCWVWTGTLNDAGYGILGINNRGRIERAHRLSWQMAVGPIPANLCVCHHCDNRRCVNPQHLFLGTRDDNNRDMRSKNRWSKPPVRYGILNNKTKLNDVKVREIRSLHATGQYTHRELARQFGIDRSQVGHIVNGECWKGV